MAQVGLTRLLGLLFPLLLNYATAQTGGGTTQEEVIHDGSHDFDFLHGDWIIENRKLAKPLSGESKWETFQAHQRCQTLPAGIGNFDDFVAESWRPGFVGMSLRLYSPQTKNWSIYWLNNHDAGLDPKTGSLTPPVVGRFTAGIGTFEGDDVYNGKPIRTRYTWTHADDRHARWEQAFSTDGGATWETNWVMDMHRVDAS